MIDQIELAIKSDSSIIQLVSYEWQRVHGLINTAAKNLNRTWINWSVVSGLEQYVYSEWTKVDSEMTDPIEVLQYFREREDHMILVLEDFHHYFDTPQVLRHLREITRSSSNKAIILAQPIKVVPNDLSKEMVVLELGLPDKYTIRTILENVIDELEIDEDEYEVSDRLIESALGLTVMEAKRAFQKAVIKNGRLTEMEIPEIIQEKESIIKMNGMLEYYHPMESLSSVGGLDNLKDWIEERGNAYSHEAREYGLSLPKGVLLLGVPGCGKSLTAKAISKTWNFPLLRFDLGKVFGGLVGESERNIREALDVAKAISPCILWIDEIEKGLSGVQSSGSTDGGTTSRVFGTFLTWMQEKKEPVFVIATANDIGRMPPELLRKGRFDEIFFVDLPSKEERRNIFEIHIKNKGRDPRDFDLKEIAEVSLGFSGAEIEEVINESLFRAFNQARDVRTEDIMEAIKQICPLSKTMSETITGLRKWASARARLASTKAGEQFLSDGENIPKLKQEISNPFLT